MLRSYRATPTLKGLRIEAGRSAPPEMVGAVIPWTAWQRGQLIQVDPLDGLPRPIGRVLFTGGERGVQSATKLQQRAIQRAWAQGTLDVSVPVTSAAERWLVPCIFIALLSAMLAYFGPTVARGLGGLLQALPPTAHWIAFLLVLGVPAVILGPYVGIWWTSRRRLSIRAVRCTHRSITVCRFSGSPQTLDWSDISSISRSGTEWRLQKAPDTTLDLPRLLFLRLVIVEWARESGNFRSIDRDPDRHFGRRAIIVAAITGVACAGLIPAAAASGLPIPNPWMLAANFLGGLAVMGVVLTVTGLLQAKLQKRNPRRPLHRKRIDRQR